MFIFRYLPILLGLMFTHYVNATSFIPVPLEGQLKGSYGVVHGIFNGSNYKKISTGEVVTSASFRVLGTAGIRNSEIINRNDFKVIYPGGKWQGLVYSVHGAPEFSIGEEVILLLSKGKKGFTINNLKMGKYEFYKNDGERYLTSSAFKRHPKLGKIKMSDFERELARNFGNGFEKNYHDKYIANTKNIGSVERNIASEEDQIDNEREPSTMSIFSLMLIFSFMGSYSTYLMKRKK